MSDRDLELVKSECKNVTSCRTSQLVRLGQQCIYAASPYVEFCSRKSIDFGTDLHSNSAPFPDWLFNHGQLLI